MGISWLQIWPVLTIGGIVLIVLGGIVGLVYCLRIRKPKSNSISVPQAASRPDPSPSSAPTPEELAEIKKLTEQYLDILQEIEDTKSEEAYGRFFLKYGRVFQTLVGLARRFTHEDMSEANYWLELEILLENCSILRQLDAAGCFRIPITYTKIDRQANRANCAKAGIRVLQDCVVDRNRVLAGSKSRLDFKGLLAQAGPVIQTIGQAYARHDIHACISGSNDLRELLARNNCHCLFANDPAALADPMTQVDFQDDYPQATELPGLYMKRIDGTYALIGNCAGTRRVPNEQK